VIVRRPPNTSPSLKTWFERGRKRRRRGSLVFRLAFAAPYVTMQATYSREDALPAEA
jgi:hypothetical protein